MQADDCLFSHVIEISGRGLVETDRAWDLRGGERAYLGGIDLEGERVLEIGPPAAI